VNAQRKNQVTLILCALARLLKQYDFGLEFHKDCSLAFVDAKNGNRYKISAQNLQDIYDKTEVEE